MYPILHIHSAYTILVIPCIHTYYSNGHNSDPHPSPLFTGILWEVLALEQTREAGRLSKDQQPDLWIPSAQRGQNYDDHVVNN